jgi:hypothetical protein
MADAKKLSIYSDHVNINGCLMCSLVISTSLLIFIDDITLWWLNPWVILMNRNPGNSPCSWRTCLLWIMTFSHGNDDITGNDVILTATCYCLGQTSYIWQKSAIDRLKMADNTRTQYNSISTSLTISVPWKTIAEAKKQSINGEHVNINDCLMCSLVLSTSLLTCVGDITLWWLNPWIISLAWSHAISPYIWTVSLLSWSPKWEQTLWCNVLIIFSNWSTHICYRLINCCNCVSVFIQKW